MSAGGYLTSAGIVHIPVAAGESGVVTKCCVLLKKPATPAKVFFDWRGPLVTEKWGAPCKNCFGDEK